MELIKHEVMKFTRKDTFAIPDSENVIIRLNDQYHIESKDGKRLTKSLTKISDFVNGIASYEHGEEAGLITPEGKIIFKSKHDKVAVDGELIRICSKGKWGFMNRDMKVLCAPKFTFLEKFNGQYSRFRDEHGKWGIVSKSGRIVVKPKYSFLGELTGNKIAAQNYKGYGAIDIHGKEVVSFEYKKIAYLEGKTKLFNLDGKQCVLD